jgi:uncharacterized membrane protein YsdA (DUF1294 family)/cold shock CspA family protein
MRSSLFALSCLEFDKKLTLRDWEMRFEGVVKSWNDDRGFGFIEPTQGGEAIFVHIKAFPSGTGRPAPNMSVSFQVETAKDGKKRATHVQFARPAKLARTVRPKSDSAWGLGSTIALGGFVAVYLAVTSFRGTSPYLAIGYLAMSLVCGIAYWIDKSAAQNGQWRIPEATLLMLGMFGGWPGAIVAQQTLRHKTAKASFRLAFWATVILNIGAFLYITSPAFSGVAKG